MRKLILLAVFCVSACSMNSGIRDIGGGTFFVSRQAATGATGLGTLRADALEQAARHCQGRGIELVSETSSRPPYILGNFPRVDITFRCQ